MFSNGRLPVGKVVAPSCSGILKPAAKSEKPQAQVMEMVQQARDIIAAHWAQMAERQPVATPLVGSTQTCAEGDGESHAGARGRANDGTRRRRKGTGIRSGTLGRLRRSKPRHR
jgi:hypothetical protein